MSGFLAPSPSTPMAFLSGDGLMAQQIAPLLQALLIVSILVAIVVSAIVLWGSRTARPHLELVATPLREPSARGWIEIGVGLSTIILIGLIVWSTMTMARIAQPPAPPAFTIAVTAHRWWWEASYRVDDLHSFVVANEIHIPVGLPVRFTLSSPDVIHSFWIPSLGGKTDVIPGQTNVTWLLAAHPGVYRGQCSEYCGAQHANMAFAIIADPPETFEQWRRQQLSPAAIARSEPGAADGEKVFQQRCAKCHAVRGTSADGRKGPDLTHVMSRATLASGAIPNNPGWLSAWISDPQHIKPGSLMPDVALSGAELSSVRAFLATLK
jgi:cytochrome c oxidase subunit II